MPRLANRLVIRLAVTVALALAMVPILGGRARAGEEQLILTPGNMLARTHSTALLFTITGTYRQLSGTLVFDPAANTCRIDVTFVTASLALPNALVRAQVLSRGFLDPEQYPQTSFTGHCAAGGTRIDGKLTMHGQTHPFSMVLTKRMAGGRLVGFHTVGRLDRQRWGIDGLNMLVGRTITVIDDISLDGRRPNPAG
ncbi:YceI family protein [Acidiphilium sp. C61]|jgi:polyisoprenoid-binding protein YceI|uniref:YceI family protein n=1 Tax=Acidiphilium sp. C61 TaxID=1671485 RepID=UPI001F226B07|nr:YceI family protein [Acidiphilium sp. C61]